MVALNLRKAQQKHLDDIMVIVHDAQQNLKNAGVDQCQDGYPDKSNILSDINQGILYEIIFNTKLVGIMAIQYTHETNLRMQHLLNQLGFRYRGIIHISDPHGDLNTNAYELTMS